LILVARLGSFGGKSLSERGGEGVARSWGAGLPSAEEKAEASPGRHRCFGIAGNVVPIGELAKWARQLPTARWIGPPGGQSAAAEGTVTCVWRFHGPHPTQYHPPHPAPSNAASAPNRCRRPPRKVSSASSHRRCFDAAPGLLPPPSSPASSEVAREPSSCHCSTPPVRDHNLSSAAPSVARRSLRSCGLRMASGSNAGAKGGAGWTGHAGRYPPHTRQETKRSPHQSIMYGILSCTFYYVSCKL
jgi:hypothetical protein